MTIMIGLNAVLAIMIICYPTDYLTNATFSQQQKRTWDRSYGGEDMYSFDYAYILSSIRDWLFKQAKD